jgi:hypothetical protein
MLMSCCAYHQVVFFFPLAPFVRGLFARPDLVPYLYTDREGGDTPVGHTTNSRGFKLKVLDNPKMNHDHRSLGLVSTTDGIPFFDDQKRTAWPFILRVANLPDGLSTHVSNCHMHMLSASEYWDMDESANVLRRRTRSPKSLNAHLSIIVDDLIGGYERGVKAVDSSMPSGSPGRKFRCHVCLLFWTGDYPAQAAVAGMHSKCCHWCEVKSENAPEISRRMWTGMRRYLRTCVCCESMCVCLVLCVCVSACMCTSRVPVAEGHKLRNYQGATETLSKRTPELRPQPRHRTHAGIVRDAEAQRDHAGLKKDAPYKTTGVKECSPLRFVHLFDLVWDILPDMMHIVPVIWKGHIFKMFRGLRMPAQVKPRKKYTDAQNKKLMKDHDKAKEHLRGWTLSEVLSTNCNYRHIYLNVDYFILMLTFLYIC